MALTRAEVQKIGLIARLELEDSAIEELQGELNNIVHFVEQMKELDLGDVEPTTHSTELTDSLRDDVPAPTLSREDVLLNAPQAQEGAFLIPRIKAADMSAHKTAHETDTAEGSAQ
jgi:aspartyl-tRNA(Asn)/glutamyl-tRNA(Gln) amidotransferase subunit C